MELRPTEGRRLQLRQLYRRLWSEAKAIAGRGTVPVGAVRWGGLRRARPISPRYGYDRGQPVDRHYIEEMLSRWSADIKGRVLEIKDPGYTRTFGGGRVEISDVLDINPDNPQATIVADLNDQTPLSSDIYDCIIFTQTLQYIYRLDNALSELHRSLKPGGVLLITVPAVVHWAETEPRFWAFTQWSVQRLLGDHFGDDIDLCPRGNFLSSAAFLYGLCVEELRPDELAAQDANFPLIVAARAVKARS